MIWAALMTHRPQPFYSFNAKVEYSQLNSHNSTVSCKIKSTASNEAVHPNIRKTGNGQFLQIKDTQQNLYYYIVF